MKNSALIANKFTTDMSVKKLDGISSLTVSNYGNTELDVIVNDTPIRVPAYNPAIGVPFGSFNLPGDGTACELTIAIKFVGGSGEAVLYYRKLKQC